ncbi:DUF4335 domain-containing protein [Leptolyngbya sp. KIOST-1]|uniref:DUF4335 domain-containing protein n=1 Tax=Leptolyngbya sp. KIOST-1 TaxID=1229172 RepID=UPI00056AAA59|nr:DUF4335 domain-containing protein [Leptolyngbya sp. KIOST-1]
MAPIATVTSYEYATGSCTLRLVGELSPLSQVTGRPVLGRSRFALQMYGEDATIAPEATTNQAIIFEVSGREPQFSALTELVQTYVQRYLNADALTSGGAVSQGSNALQSVGLTRHRLTLASPPEPPQTVELSTLQLADLADALEQAEGNLQLMPDVPTVARRRRPRLPLWIGSVAAVGIAALLGNQFLTTAPGPVVLSPSESQISRESVDQLPSAPELSLEEASPAPDTPMADTAESAPTTGEALPAPVTTAPTVAAPLESPADATPPQVSPQPSATPAPAGGQSSTLPAAPAPPRTARAGAPQPQPSAAGPDTDTAAESAPMLASPAREAPPGGPETFDAEPGIAAATAPDTALDWITALTAALQQQWRPPANLAAPLRYRLTLAADGTIEALEPLNSFSSAYQGNPTLPQPGDLIAGVARRAPTTVEVQFLPTGEVVVVPPGR